VDKDRVAIPALLAYPRFAGTWSAGGCAPPQGWWSRRQLRGACFALLAATAPGGALSCTGTILSNCDKTKAVKNYIKAIGESLKKVMSRWAYPLTCLTCLQLFETVGLAKSLVDKYFTGTASNIEGIGLFDVAERRSASTAAPSIQSTRCSRRCSTPAAVRVARAGGDHT
jgi:glutamate synthase (NADPH/NADH) large chain